MSAESQARDESRRKFEARKMTHDGPIWPVRRPDMRHPATIRERMAEDIELANRRRPFERDAKAILRHAGWSESQIDAHLLAALTVMLQRATEAPIS